MFDNGIDRFIKTTKRTAIKAVSDVIDEAITDITDLTPKDSGNAAANWTADKNVNDHWDEDDTSWQANRDEQKRKSETLAKEAVNKGDEVNISNPTPYIYRLERGSSKQAPAGMMALAISRIKARRTL